MSVHIGKAQDILGPYNQCHADIGLTQPYFFGEIEEAIIHSCYLKGNTFLVLFSSRPIAYQKTISKRNKQTVNQVQILKGNDIYCTPSVSV